MTAAKRHEKRVGYCRVSTLDQNSDRQLDSVKLDKVFTDKASGKRHKPAPSCGLRLNTLERVTCL